MDKTLSKALADNPEVLALAVIILSLLGNVHFPLAVC